MKTDDTKTNKATLDEILGKIAMNGIPLKKDARQAYTAVAKAIHALLREGKNVTLPGVGTFKRYHRKTRNGVNPQTKERITIPAQNAVKLNTSDSLIREINRQMSDDTLINSLLKSIPENTKTVLVEETPEYQPGYKNEG